MNCPLCRVRRPRRFCPGLGKDICALCCGTEREVTVDCPLDCEYLREARKHEKLAPLDADQVPNRDIRVSDEFMEQHQPLNAFLGRAIANAALSVPGAADPDVREAMESLVQTYRTLQSGVVYETRPASPLAAAIYDAAQAAVPEFRRLEQQKFGMTRTRDADVLGIWVFLQHLALGSNNGRPRGRTFLDLLWDFYGGGAAPPRPASSLILP
jgi:hypothetical protein